MRNTNQLGVELLRQEGLAPQQLRENERKEILAMLELQWKKELRRGRIRFIIGLVIAVIFLEVGWIGINIKSDWTPKYIMIAYGLAGIAAAATARITWRLKKTKIEILREMKEFELRMMEMLQK